MPDFIDWKTVVTSAVVVVLLAIPQKVWLDPWLAGRQKRRDEEEANKGLVKCPVCEEHVPPWFITTDTGKGVLSEMGLTPPKAPATRCTLCRRRAHRYPMAGESRGRFEAALRREQDKDQRKELDELKT